MKILDDLEEKQYETQKQQESLTSPKRVASRSRGRSTGKKAISHSSSFVSPAKTQDTTMTLRTSKSPFERKNTGISDNTSPMRSCPKFVQDMEIYKMHEKVGYYEYFRKRSRSKKAKRMSSKGSIGDFSSPPRSVSYRRDSLTGSNGVKGFRSPSKTAGDKGKKMKNRYFFAEPDVQEERKSMRKSDSRDNNIKPLNMVELERASTYPDIFCDTMRGLDRLREEVPEALTKKERNMPSSMRSLGSTMMSLDDSRSKNLGGSLGNLSGRAADFLSSRGGENNGGSLNWLSTREDDNDDEVLNNEMKENFVRWIKDLAGRMHRKLDKKIKEDVKQYGGEKRQEIIKENGVEILEKTIEDFKGLIKELMQKTKLSPDFLGAIGGFTQGLLENTGKNAVEESLKKSTPRRDRTNNFSFGGSPVDFGNVKTGLKDEIIEQLGQVFGALDQSLVGKTSEEKGEICNVFRAQALESMAGLKNGLKGLMEDNMGEMSFSEQFDSIEKKLERLKKKQQPAGDKVNCFKKELSVGGSSRRSSRQSIEEFDVNSASFGVGGGEQNEGLMEYLRQQQQKVQEENDAPKDKKRKSILKNNKNPVIKEEDEELITMLNSQNDSLELSLNDLSNTNQKLNPQAWKACQIPTQNAANINFVGKVREGEFDIQGLNGSKITDLRQVLLNKKASIAEKIKAKKENLALGAPTQDAIEKLKLNMAKVKQNMKAIDLNSSRSDKLNLSEVQSETPKAELVTIGTQTMSIVPEKPMTFDTCTQTTILKASEISTQTVQTKLCETSMQTAGVLALEISTQTVGIKTDQVGIQTEKEKVQEIQTQTEGTKASEISTQTVQAKIAEVSMQTERIGGSEIATQTVVKTGQMSVQTENETARCTEIETQTEDFIVIAAEKEQNVKRRQEENKAGSPILIWENDKEMNEEKDFKEEESGEIVRELEPIKESSRSMDETDQISPIQMQDSQVSQGENGGNKRNPEESFEFMRDQKGLGDSIAFSEAIKEENDQEGAVEKMKEFLQRMLLMNGLKALKEEAQKKASEEALKKLAECVEKKMMKASFKVMKDVDEMKKVKSEAAENMKGVIEGVLAKRFCDMKDAVERIASDEEELKLKEGAVMKMKEVVEEKLMQVFDALKNAAARESEKLDNNNAICVKGDKSEENVEEDTERVHGLEEEAGEELKKVNKSEKVKEAGVNRRGNNTSQLSKEAEEQSENLNKVEDANKENQGRENIQNIEGDLESQGRNPETPLAEINASGLKEQAKEVKNFNTKDGQEDQSFKTENPDKNSQRAKNIKNQDESEKVEEQDITKEQAKETQEKITPGKFDGEYKNVEDEIAQINNGDKSSTLRTETQEKVENSNPKEEEKYQSTKVEETGKDSKGSKDIQNQQEGNKKMEDETTNEAQASNANKDIVEAKSLEDIDGKSEEKNKNIENKSNSSPLNEETQESKNSNLKEEQEHLSIKAEEKGKNSEGTKEAEEILQNIGGKSEGPKKAVAESTIKEIQETNNVGNEGDTRRKAAAKDILKLFEKKMKDIFGTFKNAIESQDAAKALITNEASKIEEVSTAAVIKTDGSFVQEEGQDTAKGEAKTTLLQESDLTFGPDSSRNESTFIENPHHQGQTEAKESKENVQTSDLNRKNSFRQPINQEESVVKDSNSVANSATNIQIPNDNIVLNGARNGQTPKTTAVPTMAGPYQSGANTPVDSSSNKREIKSQEKTIETPQKSTSKPEEEERKTGEKSELPKEVKSLKFTGKFALTDFKITKPSELEANSANNNKKQEPPSSSSSSPSKKGGFDDAFKMFDIVCNGRNARQSPPRGTKQDGHGSRYHDEQEALFKYKDSADSKSPKGPSISPTGRTRTPPKEIKTTRIGPGKDF